MISHAPHAIALSDLSISEGSSVGTVVGTISAEDVDENEVFTFTLPEDPSTPANQLFEVFGTELKVKGALDHESAEQLQISLQVTDRDGLRLRRDFLIKVEDAPEAPSDMLLSVTSVAEDHLVGSLIGTLAATDEDESESATFTILESDPAFALDAFSLEDNRLLLADSLDYELSPSVNLTLRATDTDGLTFEKMIALEVMDVNEAPTSIVLGRSPMTVPENTDAGTWSWDILAEDPEGDELTFILSGGPNDSFFEINDNTLVLNQSPDFESHLLILKIKGSDPEAQVKKNLRSQYPT